MAHPQRFGHPHREALVQAFAFARRRRLENETHEEAVLLGRVLIDVDDVPALLRQVAGYPSHDAGPIGAAEQKSRRLHPASIAPLGAPAQTTTVAAVIACPKSRCLAVVIDGPPGGLGCPLKSRYGGPMRFEIHRSNNGQYYFRIVASGGDPLAHSENFRTAGDAKRAAQMIADEAGRAAVVDPSGPDRSGDSALEAIASPDCNNQGTGSQHTH